MRFYDPGSDCPKCGFHMVGTCYHEAQSGVVSCPVSEEEHVHRTCERCGAQWGEAPLDQREDYEKAKEDVKA